MPFQALRVSVRRWLRTSVRGLIVLILMIGAGLGWIVRDPRIQRDAVAAIEKAGGRVVYDWQKRNGRYFLGAKPPAPRWLIERIGIDYFSHVSEVWLSATPATTDSLMAHAGSLSQLERLRVHVSSRSVSDTGMAKLAGLTRLSWLDLSSVRVTDAGLAHLRGLTELAWLDVTSSPVSDVGIAHLKGLTNLSSLDLRSTQISDAGLASLSDLQNLLVLHLSSTQITDSGLAHLKTLTKLKNLNLRGTQVSDAGMSHLEGLTGLRELNVDDTRVTKEGMRSLKRSLPGLSIYHPRALPRP